MIRDWSKRRSKQGSTKGHLFFCWQEGHFHTVPRGYRGGAEAVVASARALDYCPLCNPDAPVPGFDLSWDGGIPEEGYCASSRRQFAKVCSSVRTPVDVGTYHGGAWHLCV